MIWFLLPSFSSSVQSIQVNGYLLFEDCSIVIHKQIYYLIMCKHSVLIYSSSLFCLHQKTGFVMHEVPSIYQLSFVNWGHSIKFSEFLFFQLSNSVCTHVPVFPFTQCERDLTQQQCRSRNLSAPFFYNSITLCIFDDLESMFKEDHSLMFREV